MTSVLDRLPGARLGRVVRVVLVAIGLAPIFSALFGAVPVLGHLVRIFDFWFAFQCHREAERSFHLLGHAMPVCSRCFGIYLGIGLGALVLRPRLDTWPLRIWVGVAALAMILDVATEGLGMRPPSGWVRWLSGLLLSYPVGAALVLAARGEPQPRRDGGS